MYRVALLAFAVLLGAALAVLVCVLPSGVVFAQMSATYTAGPTATPWPTWEPGDTATPFPTVTSWPTEEPFSTPEPSNGPFPTRTVQIEHVGCLVSEIFSDGTRIDHQSAVGDLSLCSEETVNPLFDEYLWQSMAPELDSAIGLYLFTNTLTTVSPGGGEAVVESQGVAQGGDAYCSCTVQDVDQSFAINPVCHYTATLGSDTGPVRLDNPSDCSGFGTGNGALKLLARDSGDGTWWAVLQDLAVAGPISLGPVDFQDADQVRFVVEQGGLACAQMDGWMRVEPFDPTGDHPECEAGGVQTDTQELQYGVAHHYFCVDIPEVGNEQEDFALWDLYGQSYYEADGYPRGAWEIEYSDGSGLFEPYWTEDYQSSLYYIPSTPWHVVRSDLFDPAGLWGAAGGYYEYNPVISPTWAVGLEFSRCFQVDQVVEWDSYSVGVFCSDGYDWPECDSFSELDGAHKDFHSLRWTLCPPGLSPEDDLAAGEATTGTFECLYDDIFEWDDYFDDDDLCERADAFCWEPMTAQCLTLPSADAIGWPGLSFCFQPQKITKLRIPGLGIDLLWVVDSVTAAFFGLMVLQSVRRLS